jgi:hypothetical protein
LQSFSENGTGIDEFKFTPSKMTENKKKQYLGRINKIREDN